MSSLQCPATLLLARHGESEYVETWFSDEGGTLTRTGRREAHQLAEQVDGRRVAHVWCSDSARCVQTAEIIAARLGVAVTARKSLREAFVGDLIGAPFERDALYQRCDAWRDGDLEAGFPGGETGADVARRYREELLSIADQHRGETVLVVGHQLALSVSVPALTGTTGRGLPDSHLLDHTETAEVELDADGARLVRWGDRALA